jgi:Domain of unknown function DUF29
MSATTTASPDYDADLVAWAAAQAALLRAGRIAEADAANIAEELDDVGKSQRLTLASHVGTVIEHLMKLQAWFRSGLHAKRGIPCLARLWPFSV